jgi:pre-mRNA-splicing factor ATP-dependent RNA helicase DHX15/PRP43
LFGFVGFGLGLRFVMGTERKRKVSLFDVVDETAVSKISKSNGGGGVAMNNNNGGFNRWTGKTYSQRYYEILEKRRSLPVWHQKEEFLQVLKANQTIILVGETGSGKTTQVCFRLMKHNIETCLLFGC